MQDMGCGVVGLYLLAPDPVYGGRYRISYPEITPFDPGPEHLVVPSGDGVENLELPARRGDPTHIRHLPATRCIERILLQHDVELSLGIRHSLHGHYPGLDLLALIADEAALDLPVPERRDHALVTPHRLPRPFPLVVHRLLEASLVERDPPLRQHLPRHLNREPVCVV